MPKLRPSSPSQHATQDNAEPEEKLDAANFIRPRRKELGLPLAEVASRCSVSLQTVRDWEVKGNLTVNRLPMVAAALECDPADLVPGGVKIPGGTKLSEQEADILSRFRKGDPRVKAQIAQTVRAITDPDATEFEPKPAPTRRKVR